MIHSRTDRESARTSVPDETVEVGHSIHTSVSLDESLSKSSIKQVAHGVKKIIKDFQSQLGGDAEVQTHPEGDALKESDHPEEKSISDAQASQGHS